MKPYYDDGTVRLYHGDVRDFDPPQRWASCVVSSPPYNAGIDYDDHIDVMPWPEYWEMAEHVAGLCWKALADDTRLWWNTAVTVPASPGDQERKQRVPLAFEWTMRFRREGFSPMDSIAWTSMRGAGSAWGSWQSPSNPNIRGDYEAVLVAAKGFWERTPPAAVEAGWRDQEGHWQKLVTSVWEVAPEPRTVDGHPVPFPVEIPARCIRLSTWPGEVIFDPFAGAGTTLVAAKRLGRRAVGVEMSERYCEIAARRLAQGTLNFG